MCARSTAPGPGLTFGLLSDRTVIYLMDYLPDGEQTGGFQILAIIKFKSLSTVPPGFLSTTICLEIIPRKACSVCCKMLPRKVILVFVPRIWEYLAQRAS